MDSPITLSPPHGTYSAAQWRPIFDRALQKQPSVQDLTAAYKRELKCTDYAAFYLALTSLRRALDAGILGIDKWRWIVK